MKGISFFLVFVLSCFLNYLNAQEHGNNVNSVEAGQQMPFFLWKDTYPSGREVSSSADNSKWKIYYCWHARCKSCIAGFNKWEKIAQLFSDKVKIVMLSYTGSRTGKNSYDRIKKIVQKSDEVLKFKNIDFVFDSIYFDQFGRNAPHTIIVKPDGKVFTVTDSHVDADLLNSIFSGGRVHLIRSITDSEGEPYYLSKIDNFQEKGNRDSLYYSVLTGWDEHMPSDWIDLTDYSLTASGVDLRALYNLAFTGFEKITILDSVSSEYFPMPIIDGLSINESNKNDLWRKLSYKLAVLNADADKKHLFSCLKKELENITGYKASVEIRKMPCFVVSKKKGRLINTTSEYEGYQTVSLNEVLVRLCEHNKEALLYFNKSGLKDGTLLILPDYYSYTRSAELPVILEKAGFKIERSVKAMKVIVLRKMNLK